MNYMVTIARSFGSGGKEIAIRLSKRLCIPVYDREIDALANEVQGHTGDLFSHVDKKQRGKLLKEALERWTFPAGVEPVDKFFVAHPPIFEAQTKIMRLLAKSYSCIVVGKAAAHVLKNIPNVASFFITARRQDCLNFVAKRLSVESDEAARLVDKTNKFRSDHYRFYAEGGEWTDSSNYDLVLNRSRLGLNKCIDAMITFLSLKFGSDFNKRDGTEGQEGLE